LRARSSGATAGNGGNINCQQNQQMSLEILYFLPPDTPLSGRISIQRGKIRIRNFQPKVRSGNIRRKHIQRKGHFSWTHTFSKGVPLLFWKLAQETVPNRETYSPCRIMKAYTALPIPPGESRLFWISKPKDRKRIVNISVYGSGHAELLASIDNGIPKRNTTTISETFTIATRQLQVVWQENQGMIQNVTRPENRLKVAETLFVGLNEDLTPGLHSLRLKNTGSRFLRVRVFFESHATKTVKVRTKSLN